MNVNEARENYHRLFASEEDKAKAFDKIAERYYCMNFGSMSKSDFDVLMFSIFIEQILNEKQSDYSAYSDYTLSKQLGITQTKVSNLKVRKQLLYPYEPFDWKQSFLRISNQAIYENERIKLFIPDKNLYLEVKNAIEDMGGFVEIQLTSNLLQVRLEFFLDLMLALDDKKGRDALRKQIKEKIESSLQDIKVIEQQPIGKALTGRAPDIMLDVIEECVPVFGGVAKAIAQNLLDAIRER